LIFFQLSKVKSDLNNFFKERSADNHQMGDNKFRTIHILAVSGSLREVSSNTALLQAAIALSPENVEIKLYRGLGDLPHFNPDHESTEMPSVKDLRQQLAQSDGLLISSPEYAHGVPGVLKNALDWLVSGEEFVGKPIALFNASPRAIHAQASLAEIVTTMAGRIVPEASITVSLLGKNLDAGEIVADLEISSKVQNAIVTIAIAIEQFRAEAVEFIAKLEK
jgi:chromate reductase, NAD(P)H dehydrogenase (quinone)